VQEKRYRIQRVLTKLPTVVTITFENDQYTGRFVDELREKIKYSCTYKPHDVAIVIEEREV